jgi:hypothetical protein
MRFEMLVRRQAMPRTVTIILLLLLLLQHPNVNKSSHSYPQDTAKNRSKATAPIIVNFKRAINNHATLSKLIIQAANSPLPSLTTPGSYLS